MLRIFTSVGFEPANLGYRGEHVTPRFSSIVRCIESQSVHKNCRVNVVGRRNLSSVIMRSKMAEEAMSKSIEKNVFFVSMITTALVVNIQYV